MIKCILYGILLLLNISIASEPKLGKWRWATDSMEFTDDKQVHALGSFCLYNILSQNKVSPVKSTIITIGLGTFKEVCDAYIPWEQYGIWGGDGFSKYDMIYNVMGIIGAHSLDKLLKDYNINVYIRFSGRPIKISHSEQSYNMGISCRISIYL